MHIIKEKITVFGSFKIIASNIKDYKILAKQYKDELEKQPFLYLVGNFETPLAKYGVGNDVFYTGDINFASNTITKNIIASVINKVKPIKINWYTHDPLQRFHK